MNVTNTCKLHVLNGDDLTTKTLMYKILRDWWEQCKSTPNKLVQVMHASKVHLWWQHFLILEIERKKEEREKVQGCTVHNTVSDHLANRDENRRLQIT